MAELGVGWGNGCDADGHRSWGALHPREGTWKRGRRIQILVMVAATKALMPEQGPREETGLWLKQE